MKQKIVYKYDFVNPFHQEGQVLTLEELQEFTQEQNIYDHEAGQLDVSSVLQTIDPSIKPNKKKIFTLEHEKDPTIKGETTLETLTIWVVDKLIYPEEVPDILKQEYGSTYGFKKKKLNNDLPMKYFYRHKHHSIGLVNPETGYGTDNGWYEIFYEQFKPGDIVVNKDLFQIWDAKKKTTISDTKKDSTSPDADKKLSTPTVLTELFKKDYGLSGIER